METVEGTRCKNKEEEEEVWRVQDISIVKHNRYLKAVKMHLV
jgi:hypothetical protein